MAEEYRHKCLSLEKDYIFLKNNHDYDLQRMRTQVTEAEINFTQQLKYEMDECERRLRDTTTQKDF